MKKLISLAAVLVLLFTLSVAAFAAIPSIEYDDGSGVRPSSDTIITPDGDEYHVVVEDLTFDTPEEKESFEEAIYAKIDEELPEAEKADLSGVIAVEVHIEDQDGNIANDKYFADNDSVTVAFVLDLKDGNKVALVLHQKADGTIESLPFDDNGETITVTFYDLSPVVFAIEESSVTPPGPVPTDDSGNGGNDNGGKNGGSSSKSGGSPQTGDVSALSICIGVVLVIAAGACFVFANRKARQ